jgi:hypothetical protein
MVTPTGPTFDGVHLAALSFCTDATYPITVRQIVKQISLPDAKLNADVALPSVPKKGSTHPPPFVMRISIEGLVDVAWYWVYDTIEEIMLVV